MCHRHCYFITIVNPKIFMIPFGKHKVLAEQEIDKVTGFVYGL